MSVDIKTEFECFAETFFSKLDELIEAVNRIAEQLESDAIERAGNTGLVDGRWPEEENSDG